MERPQSHPTLPDKIAESFRHYASKIYSDRSSLYSNLAMRVAEDPQLLDVAAHGPGKDALPNLFFGAVHLLLLQGEHHQLAAFYPSLNKNTRHYEYVYPYFRNFVLDHEAEIAKIIKTRSVQTNEVARCAALVPAFELVARQSRNRSLTMIEIGSSAGLTLLWDRYHYKYGEGMECGPATSPVQIECLMRGEKHPPVPHELPGIVSRLGLDLNPIDLRDPENVQWLLALVWPEQRKRVKQLEQAIQIARQNPPKITRGDAFEVLPELLDRAQNNSQLCIYHSFTLSLANDENRKKLESILSRASINKDLFLVSLEWPGNAETPLLELTRFSHEKKSEKVLARSQAHGEWLEWLA